MCSYHCGNPTSKASITHTPGEPLSIDAHAVSYSDCNAAIADFWTVNDWDSIGPGAVEWVLLHKINVKRCQFTP